MSPTSSPADSAEHINADHELPIGSFHRIILVPLDTSEVSGKVLKYLTEFIIDPKRDLIVLFSAYRSAARDLKFNTPAVKKDDEEYAKSAEKLLVEACKDLNSQNISCRAIIQQGDPRHLIEEQISKNKADLVVMGKSKRGKMARFLGSVCNTIIQVSQVPVLLIP